MNCLSMISHEDVVVKSYSGNLIGQQPFLHSCFYDFKLDAVLVQALNQTCARESRCRSYHTPVHKCTTTLDDSQAVGSSCNCLAYD